MRAQLSGSAYTARSVVASAQRSLNLYAEGMPQHQGEPSPFAYYPTAGLVQVATLPSNPVRCLYRATNNQLYAVAGSTVYAVSSAFQATALGTITAGLTRPVSMSDNGTDLVIVDGTAAGWKVTLADNTFAPISAVQDATAAHLDGGAFSAAAQITLLATLKGINNGAFSITIDGNVFGLAPIDFTAITDLAGAAALITTGLGAGGSCAWDATAGHFTIKSALTGANSTISYASKPFTGTDISATLQLTKASGAADPVNGADPLTFYGADRADFLDTYLLFNKPGSPQFYASDSNDLTFPALYFANKSSHSDLLMSIAVAKREIWLIGTTTTEIWTDVGAQDFPFQSFPNVIIDSGTVAKYSVATVDNTVFWLSQSRQGEGIVMQGAGYQNTRVSTYAIEYELSTYPRLDDAVAMTYTYAGHTFYHVTFPSANANMGKSWLYDLTTQQWSELAWIDTNGQEWRHRANCAAFCYDQIIVGDWQNGNLYRLDPNVFTDFGGPIRRVRCWPHLINDGNRVFYQRFRADLEAGTATSDLR